VLRTREELPILPFNKPEIQVHAEVESEEVSSEISSTIELRVYN